jgi:hypothetical protein
VAALILSATASLMGGAGGSPATQGLMDLPLRSLRVVMELD